MDEGLSQLEANRRMIFEIYHGEHPMRKISLTFLCVLAMTIGTFAIAHAKKPFTDEFNATYGTLGTDNGTSL